MLEPGMLIDGKYRIVSRCGQGGMSVVYMARNERANRTWAIKEIRKDGIQDFDMVRRGLIVETNLLKRLHHPHLPGIIDVIDRDGAFLIVMDFIEGRTLGEHLKEHGAQPQESVIGWAEQLCDVLGYLHSQKPPIIYRDMKPSNVMLKPDGSVVLFDFGAAREYKASSLKDTTCLGTRGYAAPEQYGGHGQTDARTDIYGLGATMYHLLTGQSPGEPPYEMYPIRRWNPGLSAGLEAIILKCTQNNPADRYQTCAELLYALEHYWESDQAYLRRQKSRLACFLFPAFLSLILGAGAAAFYGVEGHTVKSSYEAYLADAKNSTAKSDEIGYYRKAIRLDPSRSEAYLSLLKDGFLDDGLLSCKESEELRAILIEYGNGKETNETKFRCNKKGYEEFSYQAGIAYYYKYEEKGSKKNAKGYFETAATAEYLDSRQKERARRLYKISEYYSRIGAVDETGDAPVTYRKYWEDLTELSSGNLVEVDNERTALIMYQELVTQLVSHASDFRRDGVSREEMDEGLGTIRAHLRTDFQDVAEGNRVPVEEEIRQLQESMEQAERMIGSAFGQEG